MQTHNVHGVQTVYDGQSDAEPVMVTPGDRFEMIVTPGSALVALPSVAECIYHSFLTTVFRT